MDTFIFALALGVSFMSLNDYIASIIEAYHSKGYNLKAPFYKGIVSIILWGCFYYLTHK